MAFLVAAMRPLMDHCQNAPEHSQRKLEREVRGSANGNEAGAWLK